MRKFTKAENALDRDVFEAAICPYDAMREKLILDFFRNAVLDDLGDGQILTSKMQKFTDNFGYNGDPLFAGYIQRLVAAYIEKQKQESINEVRIISTLEAYLALMNTQ